ncbi:MAG: type III pantothenate kinase [Synergistaceae bacterium]|jgi:type III pantothenate kinase|nr:type III pantothenate kinase [Synergistaceae bacterium]
MLLVLDIGNTNIVVGVFDGDSLTGHWRLSSSDRTSDEAGILLRSLVFREGLSDAVDGAILSSVVPRLEEVWYEAICAYLGVRPVVVSRHIDLGLDVDTDNPDEVGSDRLVNSVAAMTKYGRPIITVDLGTAITLDVVSAAGSYIGGAIAPGLAVSMETLFSRAAKLPQIALTAPDRYIGRSTVSAVQSGIVNGYTGLVDSLVEGIFSELGARTPVIATGGHAEILANQSKTITHIEPWLTLDGLLIIYKRGVGKNRHEG